ncbi:hypothetical protein BVRB_5g108990 [Beta vulgaris subsp. vulgaris]|nr:hypothetical protein BVRB_5g108990 [Beta vulgaris subsp. vulgaris]
MTLLPASINPSSLPATSATISLTDFSFLPLPASLPKIDQLQSQLF